MFGLRAAWTLLPEMRYSTVAIPSIGKSKKKLKGAGLTEKRVLPVETDPERLVNFVCGTNLLAEGGEDIKLKPDEEYPKWLWELRTGEPKSLEEMEVGSMEYWVKVRQIAITENMKLLRMKKYRK